MTEIADRKVPRAPGMSFQDLLDAYEDSPIPDYLRIDTNRWLGDRDISIDRYIDRAFHELEKERIWTKFWQVACREEEVPNVGDCYVYDITDISVLVVRATPDRIKAYYNACPHQGRLLREANCSKDELRCRFHGFCWTLEGQLKHIPSRWDFPHVE